MLLLRWDVSILFKTSKILQRSKGEVRKLQQNKPFDNTRISEVSFLDNIRRAVTENKISTMEFKSILFEESKEDFVKEYNCNRIIYWAGTT